MHTYSKAQQVFNELKSKFEKTFSKSLLKVQWKPINNSFSEVFNIEYQGGVVTVKAEGYLGAIFALQQLQAGMLSGHLKNFLGPTVPSFKLRPLWLNESFKMLTEDTTRTHQFCSKILELGYNALIVDEIEEKGDIFSLLEEIRSYGIQILLKLSFLQKDSYVKHSPIHRKYHPSFIQSLKRTFARYPMVDYFFWESQWQSPGFTEDIEADRYTLYEIILEEAHLLEKSLPPSKNLIFYVPALDTERAEESAAWILRLARDLQKKDSILAFSAVAGDYFASYLSPHPIWRSLQAEWEPSHAWIMPIINIGSVKHGEGLWPFLTYDLIDTYVLPSQNSSFFGVLTLANHLPNEKGFHACNLWVAAQSLWRKNLPGSAWVNTWFCSHQSSWDYPLHAPILDQIRVLTKQIHFLLSCTDEKKRNQISSQECRIYAESILAQLQEIHMQLEKQEKKRLKKPVDTTLWDYFIHFSCDIKRMLQLVLQSFNVSLQQQSLDGEDQESFWTTCTGRSFHGNKGQSRIQLLESPNPGHPGSRMHAIYKENRFI